MRLLDLFCGAGGAAVGYHRAGFDEIVGVDNRPMPRYPFTFVLGDALEYAREHGHEFDAIHASPPCQAFTSLKTAWNAKAHDDLLTPTRECLRWLGKPYIIENVYGAPLRCGAMRLCGTAFGLGVADAELRRHRFFEVVPALGLWPPCQHQSKATTGVYGGHGRDRRRTITVVSKGGGHYPRSGPRFSVAQRRIAMGIDWMTDYELSQAIPPVYTEFIGRQLIKAIRNGK